MPDQLGATITVPQEVRDFIKSILQQFKDAGVYSVKMELNPGWREGPFKSLSTLSHNRTITLDWSQGRHGEPSSYYIRMEAECKDSV